MNTKLTLISLVILLVSLTACQTPSVLAKEPVVVQEIVNDQEPIFTEEPANALTSVLEDLSIPAELPFTIQDPVLLEGWIRLYNHQEPIQLWDGNTLTGHELAQFLLDQSIPVMWDINHVCGTGSCSVRYCAGDTCNFEDGLPGFDPIYINLAIQSWEDTRMSRLIGTLAHEIYHRTAPYGNVKDTLFEEFTAYTIGSQISQSDWLFFTGYDGLNPACLQRWFNDNGLMGGYEDFPLYPQSVDVPASDSAQASCTLPSDFTCITNQYGLVTCQ
jgi:hypothetical protein